MYKEEAKIKSHIQKQEPVIKDIMAEQKMASSCRYRRTNVLLSCPDLREGFR